MKNACSFNKGMPIMFLIAILEVSKQAQGAESGMV